MLAALLSSIPRPSHPVADPYNHDHNRGHTELGDTRLRRLVHRQMVPHSIRCATASRRDWPIRKRFERIDKLTSRLRMARPPILTAKPLLSEFPMAPMVRWVADPARPPIRGLRAQPRAGCPRGAHSRNATHRPPRGAPHPARQDVFMRSPAAAFGLAL
ncbi:hypothetical protein BD410DRAFT_833777 [Rickenella mellea]|uniref:Uncharacterized protein n=1 Tax=Rickenella mellea TaxID=50990 RepID=A0A4R5XED6_9AGAM|nr:hypothetical protein BD410DRAFT_837283 [Rickenella mellea]TDL29479.1 hypothetical protein BD410DRAFT_833777 [Rickenella mellea]